MAVRVTTGSRLHFGLLNPSPAPMPRRFGGCGMMVATPSLRVRAEPAREWGAEGPMAARALAAARALPGPNSPCRITIEEAPPQHSGLGSGTQLALAVAAACRSLWGQPLDSANLAPLTGRGRRSAIGLHGFAHGGFLVEGGHLGDGVAPLIARHPFPDAWRVVLALPSSSPGPAGADEQRLMDAVASCERLTGTLARLLLLGILPALAQADLRAFGEALTEYNARAGEMFAPAQGGVYSSPAVAAMVAKLRALGAAGAGQSSWGPCAFAVCENDRAAWIVERLSGEARAWAARGRNLGAEVDTLVGSQEGG